VTAIGEGKATITVTTKDGNFKATSEITVKAKEVPVVKVTGVSIDKTSAELKVNETLELKATITPADATNKEVTWSSSDERVAKVDANGKVTAIGKGKAIITVTTKDGNFKATVEITVKAEDSGNGGNTSGSGGNTSGKGGITLPSTGGNNPMYGLIVALIIVGAGAFMVLRKKKKEVKEK
ncbi:LPXTG cell wall anchor domain-containing protein, partial [Clostridium perfringens]